ncbi:MAG: tetratricopeptide repeat protein, partial [Gemmatimonadaceae bacterium]
CLAKRPADRPQSAAELVTMLDSVASTSGERSPYSPARRLAPRAIWIALPLVLGISMVLWVVFGDDQPNAIEAPKSVAVLPFVNVGGGQSDEYFSDGITDELTSALARIEGLRVASRSSAFSFKAKRDLDSRAIGRALNVETVVEGTFRRSGDRLKVGAQLTSTSDGVILWSDTYERRVADVFDVQEDIAKSIAAALQLELGSARSLVTGTRNPEAHDLYLRGRFAWNRRSATDFANAVRYFEEAIAKDPSFARAYSGLAETHVIRANFDARLPSSEYWKKAKTAALRALQLDSSLVEAQAALAYGYGMYERDPEAAERAFRRAIQMNPNYGTAHQWYGDFLASRGHLERSLAELRIARSLDPLSLQINAEVGRGLFLLRRPSEAVDDLQRSVTIDPTFSGSRMYLGMALIASGDHVRGLEEQQSAVTLSGRRPIALGRLAVGLAVAGRPREAEAVLAELKGRMQSGERVWFPMALCYIALGRSEEAIDALERAVASLDGALAEQTFDPTLDPVRSHPRFVALWASMGLPPASPDWR